MGLELVEDQANFLVLKEAAIGCNDEKSCRGRSSMDKPDAPDE